MTFVTLLRIPPLTGGSLCSTKLLLGLVVSLLAVCPVNSVNVCNDAHYSVVASETARATATKIFKVWEGRVGIPAGTAKLEHASAFDLLNSTGLLSAERCWFLFSFNATTRQLTHEANITRVCNTWGWGYKLKVYLGYFGHILSRPEYQHSFTHDFHFILNPMDGHVTVPQLHGQLSKVPLLALGGNPQQPQAMLVPEQYQVSAFLAHSELKSLLPPEFAEGAKHHRHLYSFCAPVFTSEWDYKHPLAIYRGCCNPTLASVNGAGILSPRGDLGQICTNTSLAIHAYSQRSQQQGDPNIMQLAVEFEGSPHALVDINIAMCLQAERCRADGDGATREPWFVPTCVGCRACHFNKPHVGIQEQSDYRYQVLVDGWAAAWDASLWKLGSGSVVFYLLPMDTTGAMLQPWELWYYPLLQDDVHWIRTTAAQLPGRLTACRAAPDGCRAIGEASRRFVLEHLRADVALHYTYLVLKHAHDAFAAPAAYPDKTGTS